MFSLARRSGHAFGLLVAEEARQNGWLPRLDNAVSRDTVVAVRDGVYLPARRWRSLPTADRSLARIYAAALTLADPVFAFHSAAALFRLPLPDPELVDVHVLGGDPDDEIDGVVRHEAAEDVPVVECCGLRTTSPVQTVLDMAGALAHDDALALVEAAIRTPVTSSGRVLWDEPPLCTQEELLAAAEAVAERTGDETPVSLTRAAHAETLSIAA